MSVLPLAFLFPSNLYMETTDSETNNTGNSKSAALLEQIDDSLDELAVALEGGKSDKLIAFLDTISRFHRYSFNNLMLIAMQNPDASRVAGFHAWKKLGRSVKKGEKGIAILAPVVRRKSEPEDDESGSDEAKAEQRPLIGCKVVHVFDVSQTKGRPLPGIDEITGNPGHYFEKLRRFVSELGIELRTEPIPGGADGVSHGGAITLRPGMEEGKAFGVLSHETAHELLHRTARRSETTKTIRETEAEAVAFVVSKAVGLEAGSAASDYIQLYNGNRDTLQESLSHIRECATRILDAIMPHEPNSTTS